MTLTAPPPTQAHLPNHTTRLLCSAVLTRPAFANLVFDTLCIPHVRAIAPSPGIDLVLLARHAAYAIEQRRRRQAGLLVAAPLLVVPLLALLAGVAPAVAVVLAAAIVGVAAGRAVTQDVGLAKRALATIEGSCEDPGPDLVDAEHEKRLAAVNDANVSIYAYDRAADPFPGFGQRVDSHVRMPVDVTRADDTSKPVRTFVSTELFEHLAKAIPGHIDVTGMNDARRARMVLYVLGTAARNVPGLVPEENGPAISRVPSQMLRNVAVQPDANARTYLRAQIVGSGGQVITTLHLTAVVSRVGLSLEMALHVLRPVHPVFSVADRLPRSTSRLVFHLLTSDGLGLRSALGDALRAGRLQREARKPATLTKAQRKLVGAQDFHGAFLGLREATSFNSEFHYTRQADADRQANDLIVVVLREVIAFLEARNVDTSDFRQQQAQIVNNITNAVTNTVNGNYLNNGSSMHIGSQNINSTNMPNLGDNGP